MRLKNIFAVKEVRRYFSILDRLSRSCSPYYKNQDCQRTVFVRRTFNNFHGYWAIQFDEPTGFFVSKNDSWESEEIKIPIIQYISIAHISYYLGYGQEIEVAYFRAGSHKMESMKVDHNAALKIKGKKISKERYKNISSLFIPEKEIIENEQ